MVRRFAVSTLGLPGVPLAQAVRTAVAHGCEGLEIRAHPDEEVHCGMETHDSHPTGEAARRIVAPFSLPDVVAVLWDAVHPWRNGESPTRTRQLLGDYLGYFQLKDARAADPTPLPPGEGEVPLSECAAVLANWHGWISLEWEKAWYPDIPPIETALRAARLVLQRLM
jgi:sugar phosphate isomerase/epimerase